MNKPEKENLVSFNINSQVQVKITELGWKEIRKNFDALELPENLWPPYKTTVAGFTEMSMWEMMREFGPLCGNGFPLALETTIYVGSNDVYETKV
jgi:hypothetical protein